MGYSRSDKHLKAFVQRLALLETPSGFALFNIDHKVFKDPDGIWSWLTDATTAGLVLHVIGYIKVADKSVTRRNDGPGKELTELFMKDCRVPDGTELFVEDQELRHVLFSNLKIKCSDDNHVVSELMWGLRNLSYDLIFEERDNLTPGYHLPPCKGLLKCIKKFNINISPEAIDEEFMINAGGLYRCHTMLKTTGEELREDCNYYVPGVDELVSNDLEYAEVMAKILTPGLEPDWDFFEKFDKDTALKLKDAQAAARDASAEGYRVYHFIYASLVNLRNLPDIISKAVEYLKSLANEGSVGQKPKVVEKGNQSDLSQPSSEMASKRARADELCHSGEVSKRARS